ncbi:MAG: hypothetical protein ABSC03_02980 [Verrucomicrobiota bacterium]|jgi:hypothetical protein
MNSPEFLLRWLLRIFGTSAAFALIAVVMPYDWMNVIHQRLGMGTLPNMPVVGYLARSVSLFYALLGGLLWVLAADVRHYRALLLRLGAGIIFFGLVLLVVDNVEGLPAFWARGEGAIDSLFGLVICLLAARIKPEEK